MTYRVRNIGIAVALAAVAALFTSFYVTNYKRNVQQGEEHGVRAQISGNMRALEVPGDQHQLLAGTLAAGDHIDVVASLKYKLADVSPQTAQSGNRGDVERVASRVVLRDLLVLRAPIQPDVGSRVTSRGDAFSVL